ncbi:MAG: right-handed parallel beta-helix repeat-containing protein, partial [Gammaproteobacteria bacterium]|nr:right-handed parallel beta-helix repeat-containing protein [Gammaproteobacteria bacterium]
MTYPGLGSECLLINADNIELDCAGYAVDGSDLLSTIGVYGIYASGRKNVTIRNCTVLNFGTGIFLTATNDSIVEYSSITGNGADGMMVVDGYNDTIRNNTISSNGALGTGDGLEFLGTNFSYVLNNTVSFNPTDGIYLEYSHNNSLRNNTVVNNSANAIHFAFSNNNTVGTYLEAAVTGGIVTALYLQGSSYNLLDPIIIVGGDYAIAADQSSGIPCTYNTFLDISITGSSYGVSVYGSDNNDFINVDLTDILNIGFWFYTDSDDNTVKESTITNAGSIAFLVQDTSIGNNFGMNVLSGNAHDADLVDDNDLFVTDGGIKKGNEWDTLDACISVDDQGWDYDGDTYVDEGMEGTAFGAAAGCSSMIGNVGDSYYVTTHVETAPVISSISITTSPAYTDTTLSADVTATDAEHTDPDAITMNYIWEVNSGQVDSGSEPATTGVPETFPLASSNFVKSDTVEIKVTPSDGLVSGAQDSDSIVISNTPPTGAADTITAIEDTTYTVDITDITLADIDSGDQLEGWKIITTESVGDFEVNGVDVTADLEITRAQITGGEVTYLAAPDGNGNGYDSFTFKVGDDTDYSVATYTMTIDVT